MLYLTMLLAVGTILGLVAWLGARALREEYLMVLHWEDAGTFLFERKAEGGYESLHPVRVPAAVLRFAVRKASPVLVPARLAARARPAGRRPLAALAPRP